MYNGFPQGEVRTIGAARNSIMAGCDGVVSRGVLLDIPGLRGTKWVEPGEAIRPAELEAAEVRQGVRVEAGDILFVATGRDARRDEMGAWAPHGTGMAGLHAECIPWLRERDIAVLGSDGVSDAIPGHVKGWSMPVHQLVIVSMGVHLIDNACLARLMAACRERNRYAFLMTIAPLRLERGTASPVNPIALF
jgi:kynurenine formamidase